MAGVELGLYYQDGSFRSRQQIMQDFADKPALEKPEPVKPLDFDRHFNRVIELQKLDAETSMWKDEVTVRVETGNLRFFFLRPLSDVHFGAAGTDMAAVKDHLQAVDKLPIYTLAVGDLGDFFSPFKHPEGMLGDVINPDDQMMMLREFFKKYQEKILATVQDPSHTDWIRQASGIEPQRWITEDLNIPALKSGGVLNIIVNGITYKGLVFHQIGRYNSSLNLTNGLKRMLDMHSDADFVIAGHTHIGASEKLVKRIGKALVVQMGTFKTGDDFGARKGLVPRPQVFFPTIFFDGQKKNLENIEDNETAEIMIKALQAAATKRR